MFTGFSSGSRCDNFVSFFYLEGKYIVIFDLASVQGLGSLECYASRSIVGIDEVHVFIISILIYLKGSVFIICDGNGCIVNRVGIVDSWQISSDLFDCVVIGLSCVGIIVIDVIECDMSVRIVYAFCYQTAIFIIDTELEHSLSDRFSFKSLLGIEGYLTRCVIFISECCNYGIFTYDGSLVSFMGL